MNQQELFVQMVLSAWNSHLKIADTIFENFTDEQMMQAIAPGKNRVIYLVGHLAAVNDRIPELLGIGKPSYPQLYEAFLTNPDSSTVDTFSVATIRKAWKESHQLLTEGFAKLKPEEWLLRHTQVSEADFAKEPHRNKLNVLMSRTNHLAYHLGQLKLVS